MIPAPRYVIARKQSRRGTVRYSYFRCLHGSIACWTSLKASAEFFTDRSDAGALALSIGEGYVST